MFLFHAKKWKIIKTHMGFVGCLWYSIGVGVRQWRIKGPREWMEACRRYPKEQETEAKKERDMENIKLYSRDGRGCNRGRERNKVIAVLVRPRGR